MNQKTTSKSRKTPLSPAAAEREGFRNRLLQALRVAGLSNSPTKLASSFNARFKGKQVTATATRKWLMGTAIPSQDKLRVLAELVGTQEGWLRYGTGISTAGAHTDVPRSPMALELLSQFDSLSLELQSLVSDVIQAFSRLARLEKNPGEVLNG